MCFANCVPQFVFRRTCPWCFIVLKSFWLAVFTVLFFFYQNLKCLFRFRGSNVSKLSTNKWPSIQNERPCFSLCPSKRRPLYTQKKGRDTDRKCTFWQFLLLAQNSVPAISFLLVVFPNIVSSSISLTNPTPNWNNAIFTFKNKNCIQPLWVGFHSQWTAWLCANPSGEIFLPFRFLLQGGRGWLSWPGPKNFLILEQKFHQNVSTQKKYFLNNKKVG